MPTRLSSAISWKKLHQHQKEIAKTTLSTLFSSNTQRAQHFSMDAAGLHLDYSKNLITEDTLKLFSALAEEQGFEAARKSLRQGERLNHTENRPALHTALRDSRCTSIDIDGINIITEINNAKNKMADFVNRLHQGDTLGGSGEKISDIVNIGIGGS
ncbi:MAG: glucose-6-phosphate isomerase, partial [Pseudomonadales bacterium]|nr:glucose-6-phosphate isomerase [Pseudomonadales bacterium]